MSKLDPTLVQWIIIWVPIVAGLLGLLYGLLAALLPTRGGVSAGSAQSPTQAASAVRQFRCSIILVVIGVLAWWLLGRPVEARVSMAWAFLIAGVFGVIASVLGNTTQEGSLRQAAGSGVAVSALALLAVSIPRWFSGEYPNEVTIAACFGALVPSLVYQLTTAISETSPKSGMSLLYPLVVMGLAVSSSLGRVHYAQNPVAAGYGSLLISIAVAASVAILAIGGSGNSLSVSRLRGNLLVAVIAFICIAADYLVKRALFPEANAFSSVAIGLGCTVVVLWLCQGGATSNGDGGLSAESALVVVLSLVGATALGFRFAAGYGAALVALGALSLSTLVPLVGRGVGRTAAQIMITASVWFVIAPWWRWFTSSTGVARVDLDRPFIFLGLGLGVVAPFLLGTFCRRVTTGDRGDWRAVQVMVLAALTPVLVAFFWLLDGLCGFLPGLVAGQLVAVLLSAMKGTRDHEWFPVPTIATAMMLVGVRFAPGVRLLSTELSRQRKIEALVGLVVIVLVVFIVTAVIGRGTSHRVVRT